MVSWSFLVGGLMSHVTIRHWFPVVTFCPVNNLPDLIYISVCFRADKFVELYAIRRAFRKYNFKRMFMEDIAKNVLKEFYDCKYVEVRLAFNRHIVHLDGCYASEH